MTQKTIEYALRSTWQLVTTMYNEKALKYDATMTMAFILLSIDPEGTPSTTLGPKIGMESTSLSRLLNKMEEKKYIMRKPNPDDGRGVLIFLTEQGKEKRDFSKKTVLEFNNGLLENIEKEKMEHFFEVIDAIKMQVEKKQLIEH
ncbi:MAG: MarR family winged helix-turn-helix transcriptional regulator [Flavobacteriaceae bacterium]